MATRFDVVQRLEPRRPVRDLNDAVAAPLADPLWLLGRQWQLGEHQAEDAASPVRVRVSSSTTPLEPPATRPNDDPTTTPAEAIIEGEPEDWWTPGRRIRLGREAAAFLGEAYPELLLNDLPPPYDVHNGTGYDGKQLYEERTSLGLPAQLYADVPVGSGRHWSTSHLTYATTFPCGDASLAMRQHDGGEVDWWSADASGTLTPPTAPAPVEVMPTRFRYPGAPLPRWWQIEDAQTDPGGYPADRGQFATMLVVDLLSALGNDWYVLPVDGSMGSVVTLHEVITIDAFGGEWTLTPPTDWSLFAVRGLPVTSLLLTLRVSSPVVGDVLDDVVLGIDEDANAVWAVEQRAAGVALESTPPDRRAVIRPVEPLRQTPPRYAYLPSLEVPRHWHPYVLDELQGARWLVQGRLADLSTSPATLRPAPLTELLRDPDAPTSGPAHRLDPAVIPSEGRRLERRWILGRRTDGTPVLWSQRRHIPLLAPPVHQLRFDVLDPLPVEP